MFDRFTPRARQVMVHGRQQASGLGHDYIGTEHLLLGAVDAGGTTASVLDDLGIDPARLRQAVMARARPGTHRSEGQLPFTPGSKRVLEQALAAAEKRRDRHLGAGHLLLGMLAGDGDIAITAFSDVGVSVGVVRDAVERAIDAREDSDDQPHGR